MHYRHFTDACFEDRVSGGIGKTRLEALLNQLAPALSELKDRKNKGAAPILSLPARSEDLAEIESLGKDIGKHFKHIVIAGSGGSSISGMTLNSLRSPFATPQLHFLENMDPDAIGDTLSIAEEAFFLIISKSGSTAETLGQFYVLFEQVKRKLGAKAAERFLIITMPGDSPLKRAATEHKLRTLNHETDIGGRFSVLTNVGLLPAAIAGLDIRTLRKGAQSVIAELDKAASPANSQPAIGAALQFASMEKGKNISLIMPYGERLSGLARWYRQCWAESLGKGGKGTTPVCAMGTTDQHSQLQLYLGGPRDKLVTLITAKRAGSGQDIRLTSKDASLSYIQGRTTGDIMAAEQKATLESLVKNNVPVRQFALDAFNEQTLGALLMHFMLEIIFMSYLLNVNPFDQPAVEEGKKLAREYLLTGKL